MSRDKAVTYYSGLNGFVGAGCVLAPAMWANVAFQLEVKSRSQIRGSRLTFQPSNGHGEASACMFSEHADSNR